MSQPFGHENPGPAVAVPQQQVPRQQVPRPLSAIPREARPYQGRRAGVVSRVLAGAVDLVVLVLALAGLYVAYAALRFLARPSRFEIPHVDGSTAVWIGAVLFTAYLTVGWATTGRTYGAHVLGLRVVGGRGQRLGPGRSFVRALFCVVFPLGLFWSAVSRTSRSVQDLGLRTVVVYDWAERDRAVVSGE